MRVYKYRLQPGEKGSIVTMPKNSTVLSVREQHGDLQLWALVTDEGLEERKFHVIPTGFAEVQADWIYIETVLLSNGMFVMHIFEEKINE